MGKPPTVRFATSPTDFVISSWVVQEGNYKCCTNAQKTLLPALFFRVAQV